jgi:hypothetical protein
VFETAKALGLTSQNRTERKFRLLACANMRPVWERLGSDADRRAAEAAERNADGAATRQELDSAGEQEGRPASMAVTVKFVSDAALHTANEIAMLSSFHRPDGRRSRPVFSHTC